MDSTDNCSESRTTHDSSRRSGSLNFLLAAALVAVGAVLAYLLIKHGGPPGLRLRGQLLVVGLTGLLALVPWINRNFTRLLEALRHPTPRTRAQIAAGIWAVAFVYLIVTAKQQQRDLYPRIHDECSYTIQARMLSQGRLWEPRHELSDFFESFHFLTTPVYGSIYFPGAGLMNVPGIWLRQPSWFMPVLLAAMVIAMSYRVSAELVDGVAGLLVALLVLCTFMFRVYSTMVMAQVPVMLLGLLMAWAWLRWRSGRRWGWAAMVGAFAGWAAITRPMDAAAFAIPIGLAMAWDLRRGGIGRLGRTSLALLLGAAPFIALQVGFDLGVTGKPLKTPYVFYLEQNQPGSVFGSGTKQMARPHSTLWQKQIYFAQLAGGEAQERKQGLMAWAGLRLNMAASATLPCAAMLVLVPAGLMLAGQRGRWVMLLAIPVFLIGYAFNPFFLLHYAIPLAAATALCAVLGAKALEEAGTSLAYRRFAGTFLTLAIVALAIGALPQLNARVHDEPYRTPLLDHVERSLAEIPGPAVVFFHFSRNCNVHEEPVYNMSAAWPDDARIIRAQDLGPRNGELLRYYAIRQPERTYYIMDRQSGILLPLGNAAQAAFALHVPLDLPDIATADVR
jgi:4-amino-4-deoxy-L-arabinose transferase-like glycosyltransferase